MEVEQTNFVLEEDKNLLLFSSLAYFQQHETTTIVAKRFWDTFLSSFGICMKQVIHIHKLRLTKVPPLVKH